MLVLSTMWGMMKNNLLQAQEAILGADFVEKMVCDMPEQIGVQ